MFNNAFFTEEEILRIKDTPDAGLRAYAADLLRKAENSLERCSDFYLLGFGYFMTGDAKYFERARRVLLATVGEETWIDGGYDPNAYNGFDIRASLGAAARTIGVSTGYSLFGDLLSEEDRTLIEREVYEKGILPLLEDWVLPGKRIHALDTMGHNFWAACISGAALGTLVFRNTVEEAETKLTLAKQALKEWFLYPGNPMNVKPVNIDEGGYYESVGYFDYSMHEYLTFAYACRAMTGERPFDDEDILAKCVRFFLNCWYPSEGSKDYYVGFGDTGSRTDSYSNPLFFLRYGADVRGLRYHLKNRNLKFGDKVLRALLWDPIENRPDTHPDALSACYGKIGWAMFRSGWDKNADMFAVKCGDTWNHAHADCAHFILYRKGRPEIYDSMSTDYSLDVYHTYYVESAAHNVLLFNGKGQDFRDNYKNNTHMSGRLLNYTDEDGFRYVVADGSGPMGRWFRKHHRHFLWLNGFILIYDDVECYEGGVVSFLLHGLNGNCFRMLSPASVSVRQGYIDSSAEPNAEYLSYDTETDDEHHAKFCAVLLLDDTLKPVFEEIRYGWKLTVGDTVVYINHRADGKVIHRNCLNRMDDYLTDAEILVNEGGRLSAANASIVRQNGKSLLEVFTRITGRLDLHQP